MKKLSTLSVLMGVLFGMFATSCNKEDDKNNPEPVKPKTTAEKLIGSWNATHMADDENENRVLDDSEKYAMEYDFSIMLKFNANNSASVINTYIEANDTTTETSYAIWSLLNSDKQLMIVDTLEDDTTLMDIDVLTDTSLVIGSVEEPSYKSWIILKKQ